MQAGMLRRSARLLAFGFGAAATTTATTAVSAPRTALSPFVLESSRLKKSLRGKGQYQFAREAAKEFLDTHVPKTGVADWMEVPGNAIALSQLLRFFELEPDDSVSALLVNKLVRLAEDASSDMESRVRGVMMLLSARPEENYERAIATVEDIMKKLGSVPSGRTKWVVLESCAKVLQSCGRRVPTSLCDRMAATTMEMLAEAEARSYAVPGLQASLLRLYSWMVRCERPEAGQLLFVLVKHTGVFKSFDYATLMQSCSKHHQYAPLPPELMLMLASAGMQYSSRASGRDASFILSTVARFYTTTCESEATGNGGGGGGGGGGNAAAAATAKDVSALSDVLRMLLGDYLHRCLQLLDPSSKFFWSNAEDVTTIVFAYELGGRRRYGEVFVAYSHYVQHGVGRFEPPQLALATGMLRRSGLLSPALAAALSERIETVLGELRLPELSHICATFASLRPPPAWMEEAKAVALRLLTADTNASTRVNLALAFPDDPSFAGQIDAGQMKARHLIDAHALARLTGNTRFAQLLAAELSARLRDGVVHVSPDDVLYLLASDDASLVAEVRGYLSRRFAAPEWDTDTLFYLALLPATERGDVAALAPRALAAAKATSISPAQFVTLVEALSSVFGASDADITAFIVSGGADLLQPPLSTNSIVRYLAAVRRFPEFCPPREWLAALSARPLRLAHAAASEVESLLLSLSTIYTSVGQHTALQPVLAAVVEQWYAAAGEDGHGHEGEGEAPPGEALARITVLIAHLQRGAHRPLITASTPLVRRVVSSAAGGSYAPGVQAAVRAMPLPEGTAGEQRLGRFTLKKIAPPPPEEEQRRRHVTLDELSEDLVEDPFEVTAFDEAAVGSTNTTVAAETTEMPAEAAAAAAPEPEPELELAGAGAEAEAEGAPVAAPAGAKDAAQPQSINDTIEAESQPQQEQQPQQQEVEAEKKAEKPSYYAKIFNNSLKGFLRPSEVEEAAAAAQQQQPQQQQQQPPQQQQQQPSNSSMWGAGPYGSPLGFGHTAQSENATVFGQLFASQPQQQPQQQQQQQQPQAQTPQHYGQQQQQQPAPHHTAFGSLFGEKPASPSPSPVGQPRPRPAGGNNLFFNPAEQNRAGQAQAQAQGQPMQPRPTGPRRATITRPGIGAGIPFNPAESAPPPQPQPQQQQPVVESQPLAWQDAARRVSRVSRSPRPKVTRTQQNLSAWLSSSTEVGMSAAEAPAPAAAAAEPATAAGGKRGRKKKDAAPAAKAAHGGKKGGAGASTAFTAKKASKAVKAAAAKSHGGKKAAAAPAAGGKGGKAKKAPAAAARGKKAAAGAAAAAAPKAKAKPKPKAAKAAPKVAKKKAPKPAPKKKGGKK